MLTISCIHENIAAMAGYFAASIPFISYAIVKGRAGSFMHLASSLGSATQSAATGAAAEAASGNYSFDNVNYDNMQLANRTGFNNDTTLRQRGGSERQEKIKNDQFNKSTKEILEASKKLNHLK